MRKDPRDVEAHEAKRKAGWYSAVALWIFQVDTSRVVAAIDAASPVERRSKVIAFAKRCKNAPERWAE